MIRPFLTGSVSYSCLLQANLYSQDSNRCQPKTTKSWRFCAQTRIFVAPPTKNKWPLSKQWQMMVESVKSLSFPYLFRVCHTLASKLLQGTPGFQNPRLLVEENLLESFVEGIHVLKWFSKDRKDRNGLSQVYKIFQHNFGVSPNSGVPGKSREPPHRIQPSFWATIGLADPEKS